MSTTTTNPSLPDAFLESKSDDDDSFIDLWAAVAVASRLPATNSSMNKPKSLPMNKPKSLRESELKPRNATVPLDEAMSPQRSKFLPEHCPNLDASAHSVESEKTSRRKTTFADNGCRRIDSSESLGSMQLSNRKVATTARFDSNGSERLQRSAERSPMPPHQQFPAGVQHPRTGLEQQVAVSRRVVPRRHSMSAVECTEQIDQSSSDLNGLHQMETLISSSSLYPAKATSTRDMDVVGTMPRKVRSTSDLNRSDGLRRKNLASSLCTPKMTSTPPVNDRTARKDRHDTFVRQNDSSRRGVHPRLSMSTVDRTEHSGQSASSDLNQPNQMQKQIRSSRVYYPPSSMTNLTMNDCTARNDRYDNVVHRNSSSTMRMGSAGNTHRSHCYSMNTFECTRQSGQNASSDLNQRNQMLMQIRSSSRVYPPKIMNLNMNDGTLRNDRRHSMSAIDSKRHVVCTAPHVLDQHDGFHQTQSSCRSRSTTGVASITRGDPHDTTMHTSDVSMRGVCRRHSMSDFACEPSNAVCPPPCFGDRGGILRQTKHVSTSQYGIRGVDSGPGKRVTWVGQTESSDWAKTKAMSVAKVTNMNHFEGNEGDQYKSYKGVIKESKDRSYALP